MEFLYCKDCEVPYPLHEVEWIHDPLGLEGVEFTEGNSDRRDFCRELHSCEPLSVITCHIVRGEEWDPLKTLAFVVVNSEGVAMVVVKKRKSISEPPSYQLYRNQGVVMPIPAALLRA